MKSVNLVLTSEFMCEVLHYMIIQSKPAKQYFSLEVYIVYSMFFNNLKTQDFVLKFAFGYLWGANNVDFFTAPQICDFVALQEPNRQECPSLL